MQILLSHVLNRFGKYPQTQLKFVNTFFALTLASYYVVVHHSPKVFRGGLQNTLYEIETEETLNSEAILNLNLPKVLRGNFYETKNENNAFIYPLNLRMPGLPLPLRCLAMTVGCVISSQAKPSMKLVPSSTMSIEFKNFNINLMPKLDWISELPPQKPLPPPFKGEYLSEVNNILEKEKNFEDMISVSHLHQAWKGRESTWMVLMSRVDWATKPPPQKPPPPPFKGGYLSEAAVNNSLEETKNFEDMIFLSRMSQPRKGGERIRRVPMTRLGWISNPIPQKPSPPPHKGEYSSESAVNNSMEEMVAEAKNFENMISPSPMTAPLKDREGTRMVLSPWYTYKVTSHDPLLRFWLMLLAPETNISQEEIPFRDALIKTILSPEFQPYINLSWEEDDDDIDISKKRERFFYVFMEESIDWAKTTFGQLFLTPEKDWHQIDEEAFMHAYQFPLKLGLRVYRDEDIPHGPR